MKIFVDCDVLLDVGLGREPFCQASGALLNYLLIRKILQLGEANKLDEARW